MYLVREFSSDRNVQEVTMFEFINGEVDTLDSATGY